MDYSQNGKPIFYWFYTLNSIIWLVYSYFIFQELFGEVIFIKAQKKEHSQLPYKHNSFQKLYKNRAIAIYLLPLYII